MISITILVDNNTLIDRYFYAEPALSVYLESGNNKILFDTGYSDILIKNAHAMSVALLDSDYIAISHGHTDHTGGLKALKRLYLQAKARKIKHKMPILISHPSAFFPKRNKVKQNIGTISNIYDTECIFEYKSSKEPFFIDNNILFLGQIPRNNSFENNSFGFIKSIDNVWRKDEILDDTAIALDTNEGIIIITGCSHSGICNIVDYAAKLLKKGQILDIIGGLHLQNAPKKILLKTIEHLKQYQIASLHPCHCTDLHAKLELMKHFNVYEVGVGLKIEYKI